MSTLPPNVGAGFGPAPIGQDPNSGAGLTPSPIAGQDQQPPGFQTSWQQAGYNSLEEWKDAMDPNWRNSPGQIGLTGTPTMSQPMAQPQPMAMPQAISEPVPQGLPSVGMSGGKGMSPLPQSGIPQRGNTPAPNMGAPMATAAAPQGQVRGPLNTSILNQFAPGMPGMGPQGGGRVAPPARMNDQMMFNQSPAARFGNQFGNNRGQTAYGSAPTNRFAPPNAPGVRSAPIARPRVR